MRLLGFAVFGSTDAVGKLEKDLKPLAALGVRTARPGTLDGRIELMVLFTNDDNRITVEVVRQKIVGGSNGNFTYESIVIPQSAVK